MGAVLVPDVSCELGVVAVPIEISNQHQPERRQGVGNAPSQVLGRGGGTFSFFISSSEESQEILHTDEHL